GPWTCALSVLTCTRVHRYWRTARETPIRAATASTPISHGRRDPLAGAGAGGVEGAAGFSPGGMGAGAAAVWGAAVSGGSATATFEAERFELMGASFLVHGAGDAGGSRHRHARRGDRIASVDRGIARSHQRQLCVDDLDVSGQSVGEPLARLIHLLFGEPDALTSHFQLIVPGREVEQRALHLRGDPIPQIFLAQLDPSDPRGSLRDPRF